MTDRITRDDVDRAFVQWVDAGKSVGALVEGTDYGLEPGNKTQGISYAISAHETVKGTDGPRRRRITSSGFPYLGKTAREAYGVLVSMTAAWRMVPRPS